MKLGLTQLARPTAGRLPTSFFIFIGIFYLKYQYSHR
jgi:hypothetical protein